MPELEDTITVTCLKVSRSILFSLKLEALGLKSWIFWSEKFPPTTRRFIVTKDKKLPTLFGCITKDCIAPSLYKTFKIFSVDLFASTLEICVNPFKEWFLIRLRTRLVLNFIVSISWRKIYPKVGLNHWHEDFQSTALPLSYLD